VIVLDASAVVEMIIRSRRGDVIAEYLRTAPGAAPELLDVEVSSAVARLERGGDAQAREAYEGIRLLERLPVRRLPHALLLPPAWRLRHRVRIADAFDVAAAALLSAPLLTCDARLARSAPAEITVTVVG
jgi:predicted nucleic acid-binding protein